MKKADNTAINDFLRRVMIVSFHYLALSFCLRDYRVPVRLCGIPRKTDRGVHLRRSVETLQRIVVHMFAREMNPGRYVQTHKSILTYYVISFNMIVQYYIVYIEQSVTLLGFFHLGIFKKEILHLLIQQLDVSILIHGSTGIGLDCFVSITLTFQL